MAKIQMDNERGQVVQMQKQQLLAQRQIIQSQMRAQKEELMAKFENIQRTGKIPEELMEKLGKDRVESLNNTRKNETIDSSEKSPEKPIKRKEVSTVQVNAKSKPEKSVDKYNDAKNTTEQKSVALIKANENYSKSKVAKDENKKKLTSLDKAKDIEDLKMQQNAELLELLNTEQKIEEEREKMLENIKDNEEKKRLERIFGIERAKASARIIKLSEQHEKALNTMQKKK